MSAPDAEDQQLVTRLKRREPGGFDDLYTRHARAAHRLALRICGHEAAADVAQQAFLEIWTCAERYDPDRGTLGAWVLGIVRYRAIDATRTAAKHERRWVTDAEVLNSIPAPEDTLERAISSERHDQARVALATLPRPQLEVILLGFFAGLTHVEIAARLHIPIGTVKSRTRLGLARLRSTLVELDPA